ncbi:MAG: tripartite tricarboxylate transporter substrate binding protein [Betaproteobacteria bacterium]|nr:tripartite tricarboxylate transporter substrate binding protein [Betaproteobacteria bacterium]
MASALLVSASAAEAQAFPSRPVTLIVPFAPGATTDILARAVAQELSVTWQQPVVVENKPGASGNIGAAQVAGAAPDGHTLLVTAAAISASPALYKDPGFRLFDTLKPVTVLGVVPLMLIVHPDVPAKSVAEFVDYAKKHPGKLALGSGGNGTIPHLGGELFKMRAGVDFVHVPYRGGSQAMAALIGGQIQFTIDGGPHVAPQMAAGKVRLLAVTSAQRLPQYPSVPTLAESGFPGYEASAWTMVLAPGATPKPLIDRIQADMTRALQAPGMAARLEKLDVQPRSDTPAEAEAFLRGEVAKWGEVVKVSGARVD